MRNAHPKYLCYPSVVCTGRETTVTIVPRDTSRIFRKEDKYQLAVVGLREDQESYHEHIPLDYPCQIVNGCLQFTYDFTMNLYPSPGFRSFTAHVTLLLPFIVL